MKLNKWKIFNVVMITFSCLIAFWFMSDTTVHAWWWEDTPEGTVEFLQSHSDWLTYGGFVKVIGSNLGWPLVKGLYILTSSLESLIPETFSLLDFLDYAGVGEIVSAIINDLVVALMVLTIVVIGFKTVIAKEPPKFKNVGVNIALSAFLILGMPTLMNTMKDISITFYDATQTGNNNEQASGLSWNLIQTNTADLVYIANNGFDLIANGSEGKNKNSLTPEIFTSVDMSELLTPDAIDELEGANDNLEHLKYTLSNDGAGNFTATEIEGSALSMFTDSFNTGYFRYPTNFFPVIVGLIALGFAYLFAIFVLATTIIEIGIKRIVGYFVFATDLESGQRTKMVVQDIINGFMLIGFTGLSFQIYTIFLTFLGTADLNLLVYVIAVVSATFVLIKGSSTIMRYFGVDTGVKEGFGQLAGAFALGRSTAGGLNKMKNWGKNNNSGNSKDMLSQQGEDSPSINDQDGQGSSGHSSGLRNSVNSAGKKFGYMKERGLTGMAEDAIKGTGETLSNKSDSFKDGIKSIGNSAKEGYAEGIETGQNNKDKWNNKKESSINNSSDNDVNNQSADSTSVIESQQQGIHTPGEAQKQRLEQELNSMNSNAQKEEKVRVTEEREARDMGRNIVSSQQAVDTTEKNTLNPNVDKSINQSEAQGIVQNTRLNPTNNDSKVGQEVEQSLRSSKSENPSLRQEVNQDLNTTQRSGQTDSDQTIRNNVVQDNNGQTIRSGVVQDVQPGINKADTVQQNVVQTAQQSSNSGQTVRNNAVQDVQQQTVSMPAQATQRITQQLDKSGYGNADQVRQRVIQEVQQHASGTSEVKQRVIQQLEQANVATPQQATQNVQQVLSAARLPQETQQTVQNVIQSVQKSGNGSAEEIKQKVVQDLEKADFGTKEPIKQTIMQNVQKAFSATPEQMTQNVKQVVDTVQTNSVTNTKDQELKTKVSEENNSAPTNNKSYFGSLFGESLEDFEQRPEKKKKSRFDFIKGV